MLLKEIPIAGLSGKWQIVLEDNLSESLKEFDVRKKSKRIYSVEILPENGMLLKGKNKINVFVKNISSGNG